jgi:hypothetical protein
MVNQGTFEHLHIRYQRTSSYLDPSGSPPVVPSHQLHDSQKTQRHELLSPSSRLSEFQGFPREV